MMKIGICDTQTQFMNVLEEQILNYCQKEGLEIQINKYTNSQDFVKGILEHRFHFLLVDMYCHYLKGPIINYLDIYDNILLIGSRFEDVNYAYTCGAFDYICRKESLEQLQEAIPHIIQRMLLSIEEE